jgi:hypothetical protein
MTGHRYADHPDVGRRSLAGTVITPDDVARAIDDDAADQRWRAALDHDDEDDTP